MLVYWTRSLGEAIADAGLGRACRAMSKKVRGDGFQNEERGTSSHHHKRGIGESESRLVCTFGAER